MHTPIWKSNSWQNKSDWSGNENPNGTTSPKLKPAATEDRAEWEEAQDQVNFLFLPLEVISTQMSNVVLSYQLVS